MSEGKHPGGRPSQDKLRRTYTIDRKLAEYIDKLPDGDRSEFVNAALQSEMMRQQKCSECDQPADLECKIGSCKPSTWWCSYHYMKKHHPEDDEEE